MTFSTIWQACLTPSFVPDILRDRVRYLEWRVLANQTRILRLQYTVAMQKEEAAFLNRWIAKNDPLLLDKGMSGTDNSGLTGAQNGQTP